MRDSVATMAAITCEWLRGNAHLWKRSDGNQSRNIVLVFVLCQRIAIHTIQSDSGAWPRSAWATVSEGLLPAFGRLRSREDQRVPAAIPLVIRDSSCSIRRSAASFTSLPLRRKVDFGYRPYRRHLGVKPAPDAENPPCVLRRPPQEPHATTAGLADNSAWTVQGQVARRPLWVPGSRPWRRGLRLLPPGARETAFSNGPATLADLRAAVDRQVRRTRCHFVTDELHDFLGCGILGGVWPNSSAPLHERYVVAWSCKGRGSVRACGGRR